MQEFNPDNESILAYLEWFSLFGGVNTIAEEKLVSILLILDLKHYTLLRGLVVLVKPGD